VLRNPKNSNKKPMAATITWKTKGKAKARAKDVQLSGTQAQGESWSLSW
jgi:hypothetical protein